MDVDGNDDRDGSDGDGDRYYGRCDSPAEQSYD